MRPRVVGVALGLLGVLAGPASAQRPGQPLVTTFAWALHDVEFAACVEFLMEPVTAARQLPAGVIVVPAVSFGALPPVLQREVQSDSVHRSWIPARLCTAEAKSLSAGDRLLTPDKKIKSEVVGYWAIAARREEGDPAPDHWYAVQLWTNDWHLEKVTESAYIPMAVFKRALDSVPESNRHQYQVRIGKTILSWEGELVGRDSTAAGTLPPTNLILDGIRGTTWTAPVTPRLQWTRNLPGIFRVQGKDDLAKALQASPIRVFGPMYWGGETLVSFNR